MTCESVSLWYVGGDFVKMSEPNKGLDVYGGGVGGDAPSVDGVTLYLKTRLISIV